MAALLLTSADVASRPPELRRAFAQEIDALAATLPSEVMIQAMARVELYGRDVGVTTCASPTPHASMTAARVHAATNGGLPVPATITDAGPRRGATSFVVSAT